MNEYLNLLKKLEKYKYSHPNLYIIWKKYLLIKINNQKKFIENFNYYINNLDNLQDINNDEIKMIYLYSILNSQEYRNNTNNNT